MSDPIYVAFATQKGGVGKSTLTALVASYLYYLEGVEVVAVDCDNTQHSLDVYRKHDLLVTEENPSLKRSLHKFYTQFKKSAYPIILTSPGEALEIVDDYIAKDDNPKPQIVFFDITGTINNPDIVNLVANMDYIFVPLTTETAEMASSIAFATNVQNNLVSTNKAKIKKLHLLWNKIKPRDKARLLDVFNSYVAKLGLEPLETVLSYSIKFEKDGLEAGTGGLFRSTMLPPDKRYLKGSNLEELVKEIRETIEL